MNDLIRELRVCAFCPNTCREHWPLQAAVQPESRTPSALALIGLAVSEGRWPANPETLDILNDRVMLHALQPQCTYGLNVSSLIDRVIAQQTEAAA